MRSPPPSEKPPSLPQQRGSSIAERALAMAGVAHEPAGPPAPAALVVPPVPAVAPPAPPTQPAPPAPEAPPALEAGKPAPADGESSGAELPNQGDV